jgi:hypothetical protein
VPDGKARPAATADFDRRIGRVETRVTGMLPRLEMRLALMRAGSCAARAQLVAMSAKLDA